MFKIYNDQLCIRMNIYLQRIDWVSPSDEVVEIRSSRNTRVYVERHKNDTLSSSLVPLIFHSIKIKDSGNWTCKAGNLNETIEILVGGMYYYTRSDEKTKNGPSSCFCFSSKYFLKLYTFKFVGFIIKLRVFYGFLNFSIHK